MFATLCILGRQPALGLAELESLFGADSVRPLGDAALLNLPPADVAFNRLGGTVKLCKVLDEFDHCEWPKLMSHLSEVMPRHLNYLPAGKMKLGLSVYGLNVSAATINASALGLKKLIKNSGRAIRVVPNKEPALNSAQVLHN